jgi:hypothetical protein
MSAWRLHYEANPSPLDPPGGLDRDHNNILQHLDGWGSLEQILASRPEQFALFLQSYIGAWRFPRTAPLASQALAVWELSAVTDMLSNLAEHWSMPLYDLKDEDVAALKQAQDGSAAARAAVQAEIIGKTRDTLTEWRDHLNELLEESADV